jgi:magnesium transporter
MITTVIDHPSFKWIDLVYPSPAELQRVADLYGIHRTSIQDCLQPDHLPKFEKIGEVTFLIARAYDAKEAEGGINSIRGLTRKLAVFWGTTFLITVHRVEQPYLVTLREKWQSVQEVSEKQVFHLLSDLLQAVIESYEQPLTEAELMLEEFENKIFLRKKSALSFQALYILRRKASVYQRMIHLLKDVLLKLDIAVEHLAPFFQSLREDTERVQFVADQLSDNVNHLLMLHLSLQSQKTNEIMRVLTVFSVFFMPTTFIVGVYGMNFEWMPELELWYGYPAVWLFMIGVTTGLYVWFRRRGFLK